MDESTKIVIALPKIGTVFVHVGISRGIEQGKLWCKASTLRGRR